MDTSFKREGGVRMPQIVKTDAAYPYPLDVIYEGARERTRMNGCPVSVGKDKILILVGVAHQ